MFQPEIAKNKPGISIRAILIGVVLSGLAGWWAAYGEMIIHSSPMANDYSAPVALFLFFVAAAGLNSLLGLCGPRWRLNTSELTAIFVMLMAAAAIPTRGFTSMIGPVITGSQYYSNPENNWSELVVPHVAPLKWFVPQGDDAIKYYYEGLPPGQPIPWDKWKLPFFSWMALCVALSLVMICVAVILRKQWVERERIIYPMMQLPMELARSGDPKAKPIWSSPLLWIGLAVPFVGYSYKALTHYFPEHLESYRYYWYLPMFRSNSGLRITLSPIAFSLLFFCRSDVLAGLSVFPFLVSVAKGWLKSTGHYPYVPKLGIWSYDAVEAFFGGGALLIFVIRIIYFARGHLKDVFCSAFGIGKRVDDSSEIMSYRSAVFGLLFGGAFLVFWLVLAGAEIWQAMLYFTLAFIIFLALARVIAEAGLPTALPAVVAGDFMTGLVGSGQFSPKNLTALGFTYPFHAEMRCFLLSHASNGLKIAHETIRNSKRRLLWGMMAAVLIAYVVSMTMMIYFPYRDGGLNLHRWTFKNTATYSWTDAAKRMTRSGSPIWEGFPLMGYGAALMAVLLICAHWIPLWPLNPGALVVSFHWAGQMLWSSALMVLIVKTILLKYGGARAFTGVRPLLYGLILGEVVVAGLWVVIDGFTGKTGNYVTGFF